MPCIASFDVDRESQEAVLQWFLDPSDSELYGSPFSVLSLYMYE